MIPTLTTLRYYTPLALLELDPAFGRTEGDPEILALLQASAGLNLGMAFLPMTFAFSPLLEPAPDGAQVSPVHCGLCDDPQVALEDLFRRLVAWPVAGSQP
ncbi:MAG TPA: hypothetical protein PKM78_06240 [Anaerolineae bacterium]|nr:hypothetical protein [Anaerolineae bacterium]HNU03945.1 hypothetical protein [Anaerolineae bacterium]